MSEVKQYPAWQKEFRAMQAIRDENHAKSQAKAQAENAAKEREIGEKLAKALMHFGIYLGTAPVVNEVEIDGYIFRLSQGGSYRAFKSDTDKEWFDFTLSISKLIPGRTSEDDNMSHYRLISVSTRNLPEGTGWDYYLCQLADAFDELDQSVAYDVARDAARQKKAAERETAPPEDIESADAKLLKLLRSLIREVIADELYV